MKCLLPVLLLAACSQQPATALGGDSADNRIPEGSSAGARSAVITCDFGHEISRPDFVLGKLAFQVNLDARDVATRCLGDSGSDACILDGDDQVLALASHIPFNPALPELFARDSSKDDTNVRQIIITGDNGDDLELLVYLSIFPAPDDGVDANAVLVINDGQFITGESDIATSCTVTVP